MELKKLKFSERIIDYFIQAIFIFISVFLAFWLNNYQAKQDENSRTEKAKQVIIAELEANLKILERNAPYHKLLYTYKDEFLENKLDTITYFRMKELPKYEHGFEPITLTKNTLVLANDSRVNLKAENIVTLNRLSKEIANTQKSASQLTDFILSPKRLEYYEKYEEFYIIIGRLWRDEDNLIASLKSTIQSLK